MKQMLMSKKNIVILTAALLACLMVGGATLALLTSASGTLTNSFTVGTIDTHIDEEIVSDTMTKKPSVVNDGEADCLVRVKVTVTPSDAEGRLFTLDYDTTNWTEGSDGFYYYNGVLKSGESTTPLFTTVNWLKEKKDVNGNTVKDYSNFEDFDIILYQEAIQTHTGDITALDENGSYDDAAAMKVWAVYDNGTKQTTTESQSAAE